MNKSMIAALAAVIGPLAAFPALPASAAEPPGLEIKVGFSGRFRCVLNEGTKREVDTGWFKNLIVNSGLDRLAVASPSLFQWGSVGTGNATPTNSDTSLQAYVASTSNVTLDSQNNGGPSGYVAQCQFHHVYAQGAVVGNMAEIGIGWASGGGSLWSRALILDGGGSPTTLTVTSIDQLTVYYELTCTPILTDLTGTVSISGTSYNYTGRISNCASFANGLYSTLQLNGSRFGLGTNASTYATQTLGAITSTPAGTPASGGSSVAASYTSGNKYLDTTYTWLPADGNASGGVGAFSLNFSTNMQYQYVLAATSGGAVVPKDNTKTMTMVIRFSWDRV
jgi:hypothetical protein